MPDPKYIRNFSIIAHIDHGKSTLADRLLEMTGTVEQARDAGADCSTTWTWSAQRGITIKARAVAMKYEYNGRRVRAEPDRHAGARRFSLRSFAQPGLLRRGGAAGRCVPGRRGPDRGQRLRGDGARPDDRAGAQQDRSQARPARRSASTKWSTTLAIDPDEVLRCSGKTGVGVRRAARGRSSSACRRRRAIPNAPLQAMVFDSHYDEYRGAITYVRVMNGTVRKGTEDPLPASRHDARSARAGPVRAAAASVATSCRPGQVGYLICNIKSLGNVHIGDTVTRGRRRTGRRPLPGYRRAEADGLLRPLSVRRPGLRGAARRARPSSRSTIPASSSSRKRATRWASASAAASWACCTWRSSSSGWNRKPMSTWCKRRRT